MRGLYNFLWMGGFAIILLVSFMIFFRWDHSAQEAIMVMAVFGAIPSTIGFFLFPIKGMLKKEFPGNYEKNDEIMEAKRREFKNHLIIPCVAFIGFISLFFIKTSEELDGMPFTRFALTVGSIFFFIRAFILVFKIPMKKKIQIVVDSRRKTQGL